MKNLIFIPPTEDKGYNIFSEALENDPLVLFHGTSESNLKSIMKQGFRFNKRLKSISFAKNSASSLGYACQQRNLESPQGVVIVVRFESLQKPYIREEISFVYLDDEKFSPEIIGYCIIPADYDHV